MAAVDGGDEAHVQTKLVTKLKKFKVQETPFSLPTAAGCMELNSLLLTLLYGEEKHQNDLKFDFLINGEFLRSSLKEFIEVKNLSTESEVEIEYILKEDEPQLAQTLQHDDWISAIDISMENGLILTGSYDNTLCLWKSSGECIYSLEGHTMAVKDACYINSPKKNSFLSASQDQTVLIWEMGEEKPPECVHICRGHAGSVDCLAVSKNGERFVSGSWDKMIKVWDCSIDTSIDEGNEEETKKQRKVDDKSSRAPANRTPLMTLSGHKEPVSSLVWTESSEIMSASWDHCINIWNVDTAVTTQSLVSNKVILDIAFSESNKLLATGSVDRYIRLYDTRVSDGSIVKTSLSSHKGWVSCVHWSPDSENHLLSGSYDNSVKVWDIRNTDSALMDLEKHKDKVMCVNWRKTGTILSGGADCLVHVNEKRSNSQENNEA